MLAVALGSAAALELGDGKKALGFLSSVLKYDPDHGEVRKAYKQLKEVLKQMEAAEAELSTPPPPPSPSDPNPTLQPLFTEPCSPFLRNPAHVPL